MTSRSTFRGGHAPRGGRGASARSFVKPKREYVKPDIEKHPLGELLKAFETSQIDNVNERVLVGDAISDVRHVTSYNWRSDGSTIILVPGKPPQWTPPATVQRLKEDSGQYYRDPNAARFPEYPIVPVVQAVLHEEHDFSPAEVDVIACGSTLGNLLRFVRGQDKPFRFAAEAVGSSVFFLRRENDPKELIPGVRGFGHSFPDAYTTWENEVKGSETHQRVIRYKFGGLQCLVRFECDGYLKGKVTSSLSSPSSKQKGDDVDLVGAFDKATIGLSPANHHLETDCVKIERAGCEVPQQSIFDLKTRSGKYKADIDMSDIYPQLWIKQVPNFIVAYHDGAGLFKDIRVQDVRGNIRGWEKENMNAIRRLAALLEQIVSFARDDGGLLEVYSSGVGRLEVRRQFGQGKHVLPEDLALEWAKGSKAGMGHSDSDDGEGEFAYYGDGDRDSDLGWNADSDSDEPDYTACSSEDCGYCGKCTY